MSQFTTVRFRDPFPPHAVMIEAEASGLLYGFMLNRPQTASFGLRRNDISFSDFRTHMDVGSMISIERSDGLLPWVGMVSQVRITAAGALVEYEVKDHAGALFSAARTPKLETSLSGSADEIIRRIFADVEARAEPPLLVDLDLEPGGAPIIYQPQAESFLDMLNTLSTTADFDWDIRHNIGARLSSTLEWRHRIGEDYTDQAIWEENQQLIDLSYTQSAEGYLASAVVVGGSGSFGGRPAAAANESGRVDAGVTQARSMALANVKRLRPALARTEVRVEPQITDTQALEAAAAALFDRPELVGEQLSFKVFENAVDMKYLRVGNYITVRAADIFFGAALARHARIIGLQIDPANGMIDVETQVLDQSPFLNLLE